MEILRRNAVVKNLGTKQRGPKNFLEIVGNGKPTGSVLKEDNCRFRHDINKRAKNDTAEFVFQLFYAAE